LNPSENESISNSSECSGCSKDDIENLNDNPIVQVASKMEAFYNKNFDSYPVLTLEQNENDTFQKVWSLTFDRTFDIVYVYKATMLLKSPSKINLKLYLQSWNLDDRILMDKCHNEVPQWEYVVLDVDEQIDTIESL
jgi:hypothetical protein